MSAELRRRLPSASTAGPPHTHNDWFGVVLTAVRQARDCAQIGGYLCADVPCALVT
jgi:hypothetical protein